jgi:hypothetical protein
MIVFRVAEVHQLHLVPLVQLYLALALAPHALLNATIVQGDDSLAAWTWVHLVQAVPVVRKVASQAARILPCSTLAKRRQELVVSQFSFIIFCNRS